ncbi:hypothetical protein PVA48_08510 [Akkermansia sp. JRP_AM1]|uniref:hypothetical protein n=1 Tax=Akkermansia sp. JRP_AM1 TaxID=3414159 RepID=UPI003BFA725A
MLEGVHAYLASAACSRHGEGKAVHLEVRPHAEGGGYAQLHDVAVPAVSVDVGGLGRELVSIWVRGPLFQRGQGKGRTGIKGQQEGVSSPGAADIENSGWVAFHFQRLHVLGGKAGAFQKLEGSIPDGQQERGEAQVVDSQNAVHPDLHIFLKGGEVHGEAEEVFNVKPSDGEGLHGEKLGNGVDVGAGGDLRVFKRQAGEILLMNLMSNVVWEAAVSTMRLHGTPLMVHCATRSLLWASLVSRTGFRSVMETTGLAWAGSGCSAAERGSAPNARRAAEARKRLHGKSIPYW